ncbi:MAG TPA: hypothetical protein VGM75_09060 [Pseudonocardiaceae bacterium]
MTEGFEAAAHGVEGVVHASGGDWDSAEDSFLSAAEVGTGVATDGLSVAAEAGWDVGAALVGGPTAHQVLHAGVDVVGEAVADGVTAAASAATEVEHAASEAVDTVEQAASDAVDEVEQGAEEVWNDISG